MRLEAFEDGLAVMQRTDRRRHFQGPVGHDTRLLPLSVPIVGTKHVIAEDRSEGTVLEVDFAQSGVLNTRNSESYFGGFQVVTSRDIFEQAFNLPGLREIAQGVGNTAVSRTPDYESSDHIANA